MDYTTAVHYVENAVLFGGKKNGLENIRLLLRLLGNPQEKLRCVHVAGTNGKGSVCACLASALRAAGLRTGLYTSPYLERFTERMMIDGQEIPQDIFAAIATEVRAVSEQMHAEYGMTPTFFELTTACAFLWFARQQVDIAVIEVGLGGRLDATNVITPLVCAITSIGLDHTAVLGDTKEQIALEKAGIIKPGVPCVLSASIDAPISALIADVARARDAAVVDAAQYTLHTQETSLAGQVFTYQKGTAQGVLRIALLGEHQQRNALTAFLVLQKLQQLGVAISTEAILQGLAEARWHARLEVMRTEVPVLLDGAHNVEGVAALCRAVRQYLPQGPITLVSGVLSNKDYGQMAPMLASFATHIIITQPGEQRRALPAEELAAVYRSAGVSCECIADPYAAVDAALQRNEAVVIAGSLYLAGMVRTYLCQLGMGAQD